MLRRRRHNAHGFCLLPKRSLAILTPHLRTGWYERHAREAEAGVYPSLGDGEHLHVVLCHDPSHNARLARKRGTRTCCELHSAAGFSIAQTLALTWDCWIAVRRSSR